MVNLANCQTSWQAQKMQNGEVTFQGVWEFPVQAVPAKVIKTFWVAENKSFNFLALWQERAVLRV